MVEDAYRRPVFVAAVTYKDPAAALDWLERVFGFERSMVIRDQGGNVAHSEMTFDGGLVYVAGEWADVTVAPESVGGKNTQRLHVHLTGGLEAHCERTRAAGATIAMEPQDQFYGDRCYRVRDLEGHMWTFGESLRYVTREEAEAATGFSIEGWPEPS